MMKAISLTCSLKKQKAGPSTNSAFYASKISTMIPSLGLIFPETTSL